MEWCGVSGWKGEEVCDGLGGEIWCGEVEEEEEERGCGEREEGSLARVDAFIHLISWPALSYSFINFFIRSLLYSINFSFFFTIDSTFSTSFLVASVRLLLLPMLPCLLSRPSAPFSFSFSFSSFSALSISNFKHLRTNFAGGAGTSAVLPPPEALSATECGFGSLTPAAYRRRRRRREGEGGKERRRRS